MAGSHLPLLLLRVDASTQIGAGHVMRCLALAQAWQDAGGAAHFAAAEMPDGLAVRLATEGVTLHRLDVNPGSAEDAVTTACLAHKLAAAWVVEDGYHFGADYQRTIKDAGLRLLAIDDYGHTGHYVADLVLNQNIYASDALYLSRESHTQLLLGTQYVLLRREFQRWRDWQRETPDVARRVLVTMGGGDPDNVTLKVLEALEQVQVVGLEVVAVVGASNPHLPALQDRVNCSAHATRLLHNVFDMPELMAWADLAVTAGGSTCWEMAFMGLPMITLVLAENQLAVAAGLQAAGAAVNLGETRDVSTGMLACVLADLACSNDRLRQLSNNARTNIDGHGAFRILDLLTRRIPDGLEIRSASPEDVEQLWRLVNDTDVRRNSFNPQPIPYEQHVAWFERKMSTDKTRIWIAQIDGIFAGQIRYDQTDGDTAEIDFSVMPSLRGKGVGTQMLLQTAPLARAALGVSRFRSVVLRDNLASRNAFRKAGFLERSGQLVIEGRQCCEFVWQRQWDEPAGDGA